LPRARGLKPRYEQRDIRKAREGALGLVASPDGREGSIEINQDVSLYAGKFAEGDVVEHRFASGRFGWLQLVKGGLEIGGLIMQPGDGAKIEAESVVAATALAPQTELLLFDLN
jgi:redox-sensitive bicupin YhaK (pirin superfamily)